MSWQDMDHQNRGNRGNRDPLVGFGTYAGKTVRGSLFHLFPLRVKCQNHERVPISSISPILVVHVYSSCQDMDHQNRGNRGNRDPLMVLAFHPGKTLRGSLFHLFWWPMSWQDDKTWTTKIGEIGTLSWFWRFTLRGNRGNRDPLMVSCCILTDYGNYSRDLCLQATPCAYKHVLVAHLINKSFLP